MTDLKILCLRKFYLSCPERVDFLINLSGLETLKLSELRGLQQQDFMLLFRPLIRLRKLKLCVGRPGLNPKIMSLLAELLSLRLLDLSGSQGLGFSSVEQLSKIRELCFLNLKNCKGIGDKEVKVLQNITSLRKLRVRGVEYISKETLLHLQQKNRNLFIDHEWFDEKKFFNT